ncbi:MAG: carboxypeptidase regulatory-like domain-containing protein [Comamonadaceae bacterium]|nr:carboxypeptidase regulatory-like domain-containing protein [Comamonadaceae bacterium]
MKSNILKLIPTLAVIAALSACGGEGGNLSVVEKRNLTGRVINATGEPIEGLRVLLENRTSDEKFEVLTNADGNFSAEVVAGVYDVLYHGPDAVRYVALQKTAIDLREDKIETVQLQSAKSLEDNLLNGSMVDSSGAPASHRTLLILPSISRTPAAFGELELPSPFFIQTDRDGKFSVALGQKGASYDFDVLVIAKGAPFLDLAPLDDDYEFSSETKRDEYEEELVNYLKKWVEESLDVEKPNGAMQLNIVIGNSIRNLRGATGAASVVPEDARALALQVPESEFEASSSETITKSAPAVNNSPLAKVFYQKAEQASNVFTSNALLHMFETGCNGNWLDPNQVRNMSKVGLKNLLTKNVDSSSVEHYWSKYANATIHVVTTKCYFQTFQNIGIYVAGAPKGKYQFTDESGDTYSLRIFTNFFNPKHTVHYSSKQPVIKKVVAKL